MVQRISRANVYQRGGHAPAVPSAALTITISHSAQPLFPGGKKRFRVGEAPPITEEVEKQPRDVDRLVVGRQVGVWRIAREQHHWRIGFCDCVGRVYVCSS